MKEIVGKRTAQNDAEEAQRELKYHIERIEILLGKLERNINVVSEIKNELEKIEEIFAEYGDQFSEISAEDYLIRKLERQSRRKTDSGTKKITSVIAARIKQPLVK
ncbi:MAG TPA: hypothetical protein P5140_07995 [Methanofastidiosum sp.]|nr:hypothetical protein [Methanofastidiosum sp.]